MLPIWAAIAVLAVCAALAAFYVWFVAGHNGVDYMIVRHDALLFLTDPGLLYRPEVTDSMVGFLYPPPAILFFVPLSLMPEHAGYLVLVLLDVLAIACGLAVWARLVRQDTRAPLRWTERGVLLALCLTARPVFEAVAAGQVDPVVLGLCLCYAAGMRYGRPATAGALLAAGCWIKIYPALLLIHALRHEDRRRCVAGFVAAAALVPLAALPLIAPAIYWKYFTQALPALSGHAITNIYNQSAAAFVTRLGVPFQQNISVYEAHPVAALARFGILAAALAGIATMVWLLHRPRPATIARDDLLLAASLIALIGPIAPLGWGHTYVYVLPLIYLTGLAALAARVWVHAAVVAAVLILLAIPPHHQFPSLLTLPPVVQDVVYTRDLFATLWLLASSWRLRAVLARDRPMQTAPASTPAVAGRGRA